MSGQPSREPSRMGPPARSCRACGTPLATARARYCSRACQQRAYRLRQPRTAGPDLRALRMALQRRRQRVEHTVYACPQCDQRYLGQRRCPDCQLFCRADGLGGACPECDAVLLLSDLLGEEVLPLTT